RTAGQAEVCPPQLAAGEHSASALRARAAAAASVNVWSSAWPERARLMASVVRTARETRAMARIEPELWVDRPREAIAFYRAAFGATTQHQAGEGDDIVAQLAVGDAAFWVANASAPTGRLTPGAAGGATGRTLLVVDDPDAV